MALKMELFNETPVDSWGWLQLGFNDIHQSNLPEDVLEVIS